MSTKTGKTIPVHVTAGWVIRSLKVYPDLAQFLVPPISAEEAIARLEKMEPDELLPCSDEGCEVCRRKPGAA